MPFNVLKFMNQLGTISTVDDLRKSLLDPVSFQESNEYNLAQGPHAKVGNFELYCNLSIWVDKQDPTTFLCVVKWSCPVLLTKRGEDHLGFLISENPDKPGAFRPEAISLQLTPETYNEILNNEVIPKLLELMSSHTQQGAITYHSSEGFSREIDVYNQPYQYFIPTRELVKDQVLLLFPMHVGLIDEEFSVVIRKFTHSFLNLDMNDPFLDIFGIF